ncbi:MAG: hypothetical protein AAFO07_15525 [Bacteroidota bacterium]
MKFENPQSRKIFKIAAFLESDRLDLSDSVFLGLNFESENIKWEKYELKDATFLGCHFTLEEEIKLRRSGAMIYNSPNHPLPYNPFRHSLYTWQELMEGFDELEDNSVDKKIYEHFRLEQFNPSINEALWQRIHDHAIDEALRELLKFDEQGMPQKKIVGIMGGHSKLRTDEFYYKAARTAQLLAQNDYFIASGGGPGIMEAANLGAYMAKYSEKDLKEAIRMMSKVPKYDQPLYHTLALTVLDKYPDGTDNLAIPTWFYGHEPSNLFASHIAKYFSNGLREDTLLAICLHGIIYAPGSAGTTQEIFMDATQNHYGTFNFHSPMVFLGKYRYEIQTSIYPLLKQLAWKRAYYDLLYLSDRPKDVLKFLKDNPPLLAE